MIAEKTILEGFERLTAKWSLLRDEISLNVRGEFSENAFADESLSSEPEVQEVEGKELSKEFDIQRYIQNRLSDLVEIEVDSAKEILTERERNSFDDMVYGFVALVDELLLVSVRWDQSDQTTTDSRCSDTAGFHGAVRPALHASDDCCAGGCQSGRTSPRNDP